MTSRGIAVVGWLWSIFWSLLAVGSLFADESGMARVGGFFLFGGLAWLTLVTKARRIALRIHGEQPDPPAASDTAAWFRRHEALAAAPVLLLGGVVLLAASPKSSSDTGTVADSPSASTSSSTPVPTQSATPIPSAPASSTPTTPQAPTPSASPTQTSAEVLLATLHVAPWASVPAYQRTADFGEAWIDVDHNGCDTRDDMLKRDLTSVTMSGSCKVMTGVLADPYTGQSINFQRGQETSALVQIDHVVALGNAWVTGAASLTQEVRIALANDPLNLLAVDQKSNASKSNDDASEWLPPLASYHCAYVTRQVEVKAKYGLSVTQAEHDAMARVLASCG